MKADIQPTTYSQHVDALRSRAVSGACAEWPGGDYRPDAAAWASLAYSCAGIEREFCTSANTRLAESQLEDGRIPLAAQHPAAFWPTALAAMAWLATPQWRSNRLKAVDFLLRTSGTHGTRASDSPIQHDTALLGWSWIADTHSWIEPTALALITLKASGFGQHPRASEARRLLIDRQLPHGGWNYGNTLVYGQQLEPMPDSTGLALAALAGEVAPGQVAASLDFLAATLPQLSTPQSLAWSILGLSAWQRRPPDAAHLVARCLERQQDFGSYGTSHLSLLLLALHATAGLSAALRTLEDA